MANVAVNDAGEVMVQDGQAWRSAPIAEGPNGARVYFDGQGWQPVPQGNAPAPEQPSLLARAGRAVDGTVRQIARGATFGFADEIAAGARTGAGLWGDYGAALGEERARDRQFERDNPVTAGVANVVGGVASPLGRLGVFNPGRAASLPGAVARGMGAGAAGGAVSGFGEGEGGLETRAGSALLGGGIGAAVGGALPLAIAGGQAVAGAVGRRVGLASGAPEAERMILRDLQRDGVDPQTLLARTQEAATAGRPEVLADMAGENVRQSAQVIARTPGAGRQQAADLVAARGGAAQGERLAAEVRRAVSGEDFRETTQNLLTTRAQSAAPLYDAAYAVQLPADARLGAFLRDPDVTRGVQEGITLARREALAAGQEFNPASLGVAIGQDGAVTLTGGASTRLFDIAKRGLDAMIDGATTGAERRSLRQVRDAMVSRVDELNPAFAEARAAYAGPSASLNALEMGRRLLTEGVDAAEVTARDIARLAPGEREFFRTGVARGLMDRLGRATDGAEQTRLNQMFGSPAVRDRLRAAFDSDEDFTRFAGALRSEANMAATNRAIAPNGGSPTMPMQERAADLRAPPSSGVLLDPTRAAETGPLSPSLIRAGVTGGVTAPVFQGMERLQQAMVQGRYQRNTEAMAPMLFGNDPAAREQIARQLMARALADERAATQVAPRIRALSRGLAVGGSLNAND